MPDESPQSAGHLGKHFGHYVLNICSRADTITDVSIDEREVVVIEPSKGVAVLDRFHGELSLLIKFYLSIHIVRSIYKYKRRISEIYCD